MNRESKSEKLLENCLFFATNRFTRKINKLSEECFKRTGFSPNYGFALMLIKEANGIASSDLAKELSLAPSTITRFIDKLIANNLCRREIQGKKSYLYITKEGEELILEVEKAWKELYLSYSEKLGKEEGIELTRILNSYEKAL